MKGARPARVRPRAFAGPDEFTTEVLRDFLEDHWGDSSPAPRRQRLAIVKGFFRWATDERGRPANPAEKIKPPKRASVERQAYAPDVIDTLRRRSRRYGIRSRSSCSASWRSVAARRGC